MAKEKSKKLTTGLPKEVAGALSYVLGPITGIAFLVLEKDEFVRYHAMQSIVFFVAWMVLNTLLAFTIILAPLAMLLMVVGFIIWLMLIYKANKGEKWELPFLGKYTKKFLKTA